MLLRFGFVGALLAVSAMAAPPEGRDAASPRFGPFYDVRIVASDVPADLDALNAQGYIISSVDGNLITLVATTEELLSLGADGYDIVEAEAQEPPRGKRGGKGLGVYHTYATLTSELEAYALAYGSAQGVNPDICRLVSLGKSVQDRDLWAVKISDKPNKEEAEPEFKYVATMHGDEPLGTEMCLYFIDLLLTQYESDSRIKDLVDNTEIWIVPLMNPDGLEAVTRFNNDGIDLNRNFPTWPEEIAGTVFDGGPLDTAGRAIEVQHMMEWSAEHSFVSSANFHGGARIVNYPFDDDDKGSGVEAVSPDDAMLQDISLRYSTPNSPMFNNPVPDSPGGIINGALWYEITGGMQDWNYRFLGCNEVTIELAPTKIPNENQLVDFWDENRESMLAYAEAVHIGVTGKVKDRDTGDPVYAKVLVTGNSQPVFSDPDVGDFHRMLLPGTYTLRVSAPGYKAKRLRDVVVTANAPTRVNVKLKPLPLKTDIDGDGATNSIDVQRIVNALLATSDDPGCDVDSSGKLDATDLQLVVLHMRGSRPDSPSIRSAR